MLIMSQMLLKQFHKPSPSHHHFYRWYVYHSQSWVVYEIALPTLSRRSGSAPPVDGFYGGMEAEKRLELRLCQKIATAHLWSRNLTRKSRV